MSDPVKTFTVSGGACPAKLWVDAFPGKPTRLRTGPHEAETDMREHPLTYVVCMHCRSVFVPGTMADRPVNEYTDAEAEAALDWELRLHADEARHLHVLDIMAANARDKAAEHKLARARAAGRRLAEYWRVRAEKAEAERDDLKAESKRMIGALIRRSIGAALGVRLRSAWVAHAIEEIESLRKRIQELEDAGRTLIPHIEIRDERDHAGRCSPPATPCDGGCMAYGWGNQALAKFREALAQEEDGP